MLQKIAIFIIILIVSACKTHKVVAKSECDSIFIKNIQFDCNEPEIAIVTINIDLPKSDFLNYPHVSEILNTKGDTIATGSLIYYGQNGQSTDDYRVTKTKLYNPKDSKYIVFFRFDRVCALTYFKK
jgi:hypothetical protein